VAKYVVGDVHGCYGALRRLLRECGYRSRRDHLWFVGDLVNRGPSSLDVLDFVMDLDSSRTRCVLGNHDLHLVACAEGVAKPERGDALEEVLESPRVGEIVDWILARPLLVEEGRDVMVHAGWLPEWSIGVARREAMLVSESLQTKAERREVLARRRGAEVVRWDAALPRPARARAAMAALTRLRLCAADGRAEFGFKGSPEEAPCGLLPWFRVPGHRRGRARVIFGHWAALGLVKESRVLALDTGCVWGGKLTAIRLEDLRVTQVSST